MKILPIWQPVGHSTHLISQKVGEKYNVKTAHTGTLDPMAEGVIIVLLGEERFKKYDYAKWPKEYDFEIIFGISTDSYDGMGLVTEINFSNTPKEKNLKEALSDFTGDYKQKAPPLSTKKIKGKHLHEYYRAGKKVDLPDIKGEIYEITLKSFSLVESKKVFKEIVENINLVTGDFRQGEIIEQWETLLKEGEKLPQKITKAKLHTKISKGIYIRSLSQDISEKLGTIGFANNIVRTKNGKYDKRKCKTLEDVFGKNFKKVYDFNSRYKFTMIK